MNIPVRDRRIPRELGEQQMAAATLPAQKQNAKGDGWLR